MRWKVEECRTAEEVKPFLPWVEKAIAAIYPQELGPRAFDTARSFLLGSLGHKDAVFLVALEDSSGSPAGILFAARRADAFLGSGFPFLYVLFTAPEFRRLGAAAALLARCEQLLRERGASSLVGLAMHNDDAIISMGERRGYLREGGFMAKEL